MVLHFAGDERVRALCLRCKGIVSPGTADDRDCAEHFADRRAAHRRKPQRFLNVQSKVPADGNALKQNRKALFKSDGFIKWHWMVCFYDI